MIKVKRLYEFGNLTLHSLAIDKSFAVHAVGQFNSIANIIRDREASTSLKRVTVKGLTGLGRFGSINSYLLASSYGLGYMSSFSEPLFTVSLFCIVRHVPK